MKLKNDIINNSLFIIIMLSSLFLLFSKNKLEDSLYLLKSRTYTDSLKLELIKQNHNLETKYLGKKINLSSMILLSDTKNAEQKLKQNKIYILTDYESCTPCYKKILGNLLTLTSGSLYNRIFLIMESRNLTYISDLTKNDDLFAKVNLLVDTSFSIKKTFNFFPGSIMVFILNPDDYCIYFAIYNRLIEKEFEHIEKKLFNLCFLPNN